MKYLPKIKIKLDQKNETDLFMTFLNHPYYPQNKVKIFRAFPTLESLLVKSTNEKRVIQKFINVFYTDHQKEINKIIQKSEIIIKMRGKLALKALGDTMDYQWAEQVTYYAIPTILPFSPFKDNKFYYSIFSQIFDENKKDVLFIAIHEISHFIFYHQLKKIELSHKIILNEDAKNYLKEALAPVVLNQKLLKNILKIKNYRGNPEIHDLRVQESNGTVSTFFDYLYEKNKKNKKHSFSVYLLETVKIIKLIENELSKKRIIWNKYGNQLVKNKSALLRYQKPIKIKTKDLIFTF